MSDDWQVVEEALDRLVPKTLTKDAYAALARLREREAQLEAQLIEIAEKGYPRVLQAAYEESQARVAQLERELQHWSVGLGPGPERMKELRDAMQQIARCALAHPEGEAWPPEGGDDIDPRPGP